MKIGIVGKPSSGKTTLLNAATLGEFDVGSYPFTTIDPNKGVAFAAQDCPCKELDVECDPKNSKCKHGKRMIPVNMLDVAGLVPGASEGKGMGNEFLDSVREASALIHVLDASGKTNEKGEHVEGHDHDPAVDMEFLEDEIDEWFAKIVGKNWESGIKKMRTQKMKLEDFLNDKLSGLGIRKSEILKAFREVGKEKPEDWSDKDIKKFAKKLRRISKPMIHACNKCDVPGAEENIKTLRNRYGDKVFVPCSAESELALKRASEAGVIDYVPGDSDFKILEHEIPDEKEEALEFIRENVLNKYRSTGVEEVINKAVFDLLNYIVVYPVENENKYTDKDGNVLPDAVLLPKGSTPVDLAYKVHSDIGDKYIKAIDARTNRTLGKDKELKNNDIIKIVTE